jgi:hypothetical protein
VCVIAVEALYGTLHTLDSEPTITCADNDVTAESIALTTEWVTIGSQRYRPGQAFQFELVTDDASAGDKTLEIEGVASADAAYETTATKTVRVATPEA